MEKLGFPGSLVQDTASSAVSVLRVASYQDGLRLRLLARMHCPGAWRWNMVRSPSGEPQQALNLKVSSLTLQALDTIKEILENVGIRAHVTHSVSLGGEDVIRVEGKAEISKLRAFIVAAGAPPFPAATHLATSQGEDVIIQRRNPDGTMTLDNPMGPALLTADSAFYALDGGVLSPERWLQDPRVASTPALGGDPPVQLRAGP